ncbi:hypothetical protein C464_11488 [Halorubrum coriense DSM 10284]|uniref:DUF7969 domain-containing protein n=1 Tax=Halorubrum coriense DSM 10284 TaxID=1227466 RepID=M0EEK3_9EURY|nr:hypothetical protein [Halorubrum coriense]ELZ46221.1 hypothetical protein C464_11488 [Halorubrum coriense DSM 10284]
MSYPVTYYCPHCGTLVALEREGYLADKSVTPYPLEGWTYVAPTEPFDADESGESDESEAAADGVRFVCGESDGVEWDPHDGVRGTDVGGDEPYREPDAGGVGCGEPFYLSFVRYDEGREVDPSAETELVEIDPDPRPSGPRGPSGPGAGSGPGDSDGGFW